MASAYPSPDPSKDVPLGNPLFPPSELSRILGGAANGYPPESFCEEYYQPFHPSPSDRPVTPLIPSLMARGGPIGDYPIPIPIRQQPLEMMLGELDQMNNGRATRMMDSSHMFGRGSTRAPTFDDPEPANIKEANAALEAHIKSREPYFNLASRRLHNAMGQSEDLPFDLPFQVKPPPMGSDQPSKRGANGISKGKDCITNGVNVKLIDPKTYQTGVEVDPATGKGLREWLFAMGKLNGSQRKQECYSVAFHDVRENATTGQFSNVLIAQFGVQGGGLGARIEVFETELPTTILHKESGIELDTTEKWLWFLITRDLVTINPADTCTIPDGHESEDMQQPYRDQFDDPKDHNAYVPLAPAPNFPHPIPVSWVVFAVPGSNIIAHPIQDDSHTVGTPPQRRFPYIGSLPPAAPLGKLVYKRRDYDYSFGGMPVFEFSGHKSGFLPINPAAYGLPDVSLPEFLSVDIGPFHPGEEFGERDETDLCVAKYGALNRHDSLPGIEKARLWYKCRDVEMEHPSKFHGTWWDIFTDKVYEDAGKWIWIRKAMQVGKCRIVLRWSEWKENEAAVAEYNREMKGLGVDMEGLDDGGVGSSGMGGGMVEDGRRKKKRRAAKTRSRSNLSSDHPIIID